MSDRIKAIALISQRGDRPAACATWLDRPAGSAVDPGLLEELVRASKGFAGAVPASGQPLVPGGEVVPMRRAVLLG